MTIIEWLEGKKTYIIAAATYIYGITGCITGHMSLDTAIGVILASGGLASLRGAIAKLEEYLPLLIEVWNVAKTLEAAPVTPATPEPAPIVPAPPTPPTVADVTTMVNEKLADLQAAINAINDGQPST